jgi:hypothetical protein
MGSVSTVRPAWLVCLVGCAEMACAHQRHDQRTQNMLAASGFQMKLADTPEKMSHVQSFPQREIVPVNSSRQAAA